MIIDKLIIFNNDIFLSEDEINILSKYDNLGVNKIFFSENKISPKYYCSFDYNFCKENKDKIEKLIEYSSTKLFFLINNSENKDEEIFEEKYTENPKFININFIYNKFLNYNEKNSISNDFFYFKDMGNEIMNYIQVGNMLEYKNIILYGFQAENVSIESELRKFAKILNTEHINVKNYLDLNSLLEELKKYNIKSFENKAIKSFENTDITSEKNNDIIKEENNLINAKKKREKIKVNKYDKFEVTPFLEKLYKKRDLLATKEDKESKKIYEYIKRKILIEEKNEKIRYKIRNTNKK